MIYIDMDGVVADFEKGIKNFYGKPYDQLTEQEQDIFWNIDCHDYSIFARLPLIDEGFRFIDHLHMNRIEFAFLTSTGGGMNHTDIARQKMSWIERHFGWVGPKPITFVTGTKSKGMFSKKGTLLFDDRQKVVDEFNRGEGFAVLFQPPHWKASAQKALEWIS